MDDVLEEPAIEIDGLRVVRGGATALRDVTLIRRATVTGLLGPSGSGKTTLMRSVVGVQLIRGGTVRVLGEPAGSPSLRRRVGYMTQAPSVYGDLTVRENLRYFARILGAPARRVEQVLDLVDLGAEASRVVNGLSGGERTRVSLASALVGAPDVLVLDEPTVGLDPILRRDLWDTFARLAAEGATLLVSSHVMNEAERCERLLILREGRLLASDSAAGIALRAGTDDMDEAFLRLIAAEEGS